MHRQWEDVGVCPAEVPAPIKRARNETLIILIVTSQPLWDEFQVPYVFRL